MCDIFNSCIGNHAHGCQMLCQNDTIRTFKPLRFYQVFGGRDHIIMSGLIWVQTVCKGYQQTTQVGKELIMWHNLTYDIVL